MQYQEYLVRYTTKVISSIIQVVLLITYLVVANTTQYGPQALSVFMVLGALNIVWAVYRIGKSRWKRTG